MTFSWEEIHDLETKDIRRRYPAAIDALEARLDSDPSDKEAVIRLGFNYWLAVVESDPLRADLPTEEYATRFMEIFWKFREKLQDDADFCWAYGLGISMFWYHFPGADEQLGKSLQQRAGQLDPFWERMRSGGVSQEEIVERLAGRGVFAAYYAAK